METENLKIELKVFSIDKNFYELRGKSSEEIILIIKENHIRKLRHKLDKLEIKLVNPQITTLEDGEFKFWSYCFRQPQEKYYWKMFLPDALTATQDFNILEFSYVLFIVYKSEIYCVISGSGMNVIKKYVNPSFGIETYQRIAEPADDNLIDLQTRSISNNISSLKKTFNLNQTILETIQYSDILVKIKIKIREELKKGILKKYNLAENMSILEVGSYFHIRTKIDFEMLKQLVIDLNEINFSLEPKQLTLFSKVNKINLVEKLDNHLLDLLVNDVQRYNDPKSKKQGNEVIEIVHPTKLEKFYECNQFVVRFKFSRGKTDIVVTKRSDLYDQCTKYMFECAEDIGNRTKLRGDAFNLNIVGYINQKDVTYGNLFSHITGEIDFENKKYFRIDGYWYILEDKFIDKMNEDAKACYIKYKLKENILSRWDDDDDEDIYNTSYHELDGYYVLDKVLNDNIELCDILAIKDNTAYFIHVKNGFDAKMRDLYIQVILSAKRLSNDLKNNSGSSYLKKTLKNYNKRNPNKIIDIDPFLQKIRNNELVVNFVMAFKNNHYSGDSAINRIDKCQSNIAKYSLVQTVKEMQEFNFGIEVVDISDIT